MNPTRANEILSRIDDALAGMNAIVESQQRLDVVERVTAIVDQGELDELCYQARDDLDATICLVTLLDDTHQTFLGSAGMDPSDAAAGTDVGDSLCKFVVATGTSLQVDDTTVYCSITPGLAAMAGAAMHSYYGEPIYVESQTVGSFCALDAEARHWTSEECEIVRSWAVRVADRLTEAIATPS